MGFQQDYILRLVEKLAELVAQVMGLKKRGRLDEASETAERAYGDLLGLPAGLIDFLDATTLAGLLGPPEKIAAVADLLDAEAAVFQARGDSVRAARRRDLASSLRDRIMA